MKLRGGTFCSGIGAPEVAAPFVEWVAASDIDPFCAEIFRHRHSSSIEWHEDMTGIDLRRSAYVSADVIVAGTPCQAFSVAGQRLSLSDPRGLLTLKLVEACHALKADGSLRSLIWENVPGILGRKDNPFGCFVGGIVGAGEPLPPPDGRRWPRFGMVSGPEARICWRVLDAQWFGLPQRRQRVFVVADFGGGPDPAAVLFERDGGPGSSRSGRPTREAIAGLAQARSDVDRVAPTLTTRSTRSTRNDPSQEALIVVNPETCLAMNLRGREGGAMPECSDVVSLRSASGGSSSSYVAYDLAQVTSSTNRSNPRPGDPMGTLAATSRPVIAFNAQQDPISADVLMPLDQRSFGSAIAGAHGVRRLTPKERERAQGFPDDFTLIDFAPRQGRKPKPASDTRRDKAIGNSMAVPVLRWLLSRLAVEMGAEALTAASLQEQTVN